MILHRWSWRSRASTHLQPCTHRGEKLLVPSTYMQPSFAQRVLALHASHTPSLATNRLRAKAPQHTHVARRIEKNTRSSDVEQLRFEGRTVREGQWKTEFGSKMKSGEGFRGDVGSENKSVKSRKAFMFRMRLNEESIKKGKSRVQALRVSSSARLIATPAALKLIEN